MQRKNPTLGMIELWHRLCKRGYTRCLESLFRLMRKLEMFWQAMPSKVIQTQVLRADAISRLARLGRCESGAPEMPGQPQRAPVPVHGNRRIHSIALFMRLGYQGTAGELCHLCSYLYSLDYHSSRHRAFRA